MTILQTILLGVVEGVTEFLPISSTAHLILSARLLQLPSTDALESFTIAIQCGAMAAALGLYAPLLRRSKRIWVLVSYAFVPTAIIGFVLHGFIKHFLFESLPIIAAALGIGGVVIIICERYFAAHTPRTTQLEDMTIQQAILIGVCQSIAVIPGVSRSAATIIGGQALGVRRHEIVEFSFLLAIPTLGAATALDLWKARHILVTSDLTQILLGTVVSGVTAWFVMKWLLQYIQRHSFTGFGIYRILLALAIGASLLLYP